MSSMNERDYSGWTKYIWLIYVIPFTAFPILTNASGWRIALAWLATAVFIVIYLAGYRVSRKRLLFVIGAITLLGAAFMPVNYGAGAFFIFAASFAGECHPARARRRTGGRSGGRLPATSPRRCIFPRARCGTISPRSSASSARKTASKRLESPAVGNAWISLEVITSSSPPVKSSNSLHL